ncbi:MAG TPA: UDP-4-amino-4,6-dideoxy-N-acetyl-beta-L-altrosamine transaminase, partial [Deltaproteobacteria bacterium]|nr:UDP-4-amino-4,6-dideoxy-N-acetyl-beta-L-altrosamine transaminase [Deltaproteobacteria bacterium]
TVFSFHPVKAITTCEGGAVTTNDKRLYERLKRLRTHGVTKDEVEFELPSDG